MSSHVLLPNKNYTIYNALTWGNFAAHYRKASEGSFSHGILALAEFIPVVSQAVSLTELAISRCFKPIQIPEELRAKEVFQVRLPEEIDDLDEAIFPLHRHIDSQYRTLPWPPKMQKIVVMTSVCGGMGDVSAAAKAIDLMNRICPTLTFDWFLYGGHTFDASKLLTFIDPSKVHIRMSSQPPEKEPGHFLLTGPVRVGWNMDYIEQRINRKIAGPIFGFMENAENPDNFSREISLLKGSKAHFCQSSSAIYPSFHSLLFPSSYEAHLPMGLQHGTGLFFDQSRINVPLSRQYCCPSYLPQIEDVQLRNSILESMGVFDGHSEPDFDRYSFNFGYAHKLTSWEKFIDCVAIHEKNKHVVIVLNHVGASARLSEQEFCDQILTPDRLAFLKEKGYATVLFKGEVQNSSLLQQTENSPLGRCFTVVVRSSFTPKNIRFLQFAAERMLATGDNSAVEAWLARCILYLYEDFGAGCKWRFLQQQVDLAQTISPNLSKVLALFGGDKRLSDSSRNNPFSKQQTAELEQLLDDPNLSGDTFKFCNFIAANYSFDKVLEGALKRAAWHYCIPELENVEAETLDLEFRAGIISYIKNSESAEKTLTISRFPEFRKRVAESVHQYLSQDDHSKRD